MSFLDNLENSLKALEGRDEGESDNRARRDAELAEAKAAAPWADKLKNGPWTKILMGLATRAGFQRRVKVNIVWLGTTLRLDARSLRLELRPQRTGIQVVINGGGEKKLLNLEGEPAEFVKEWARLLDEEIAAAPAIEPVFEEDED